MAKLQHIYRFSPSEYMKSSYAPIVSEKKITKLFTYLHTVYTSHKK